MKCGIKINKKLEAFPIFITRKNGKMEKEVFTINLLFLYYPILRDSSYSFGMTIGYYPYPPCHSSSLWLSESLAKTYVILRRKASKNLLQ